MSNHPIYQTFFSPRPINDLLTQKEAAEYLGVCENTLAIWACKKRHALKYIKVGRLTKYRKAHLDEFLERQTVERKYD